MELQQAQAHLHPKPPRETPGQSWQEWGQTHVLTQQLWLAHVQNLMCLL